MKLRSTVIAALALGVVAAAGADVVPIGEFTGDAFEGFENVAPPGGVPGPVPIFNGDVTINDTFANNLVIATSLTSHLTDPPTSIFPYNGNLMGLSVLGRTKFTFTTPATAFGGFVNTADDLVGSMVTIRDTEGAVLLSEPITIARDNWAWHGWSSTTPIGSIEFQAHVNPGFPLAYDDLQVSFVPEPGIAALLITGSLLALRRRG